MTISQNGVADTQRFLCLDCSHGSSSFPAISRVADLYGGEHALCRTTATLKSKRIG